MSGLMLLSRILLGHYETVDLIGGGAEGDVYKGRDLDTGAFVAIKRLTACPSDPHFPEQLARLKRAAQVRVGHPRVVEAIECGEEDGEWYLVMPFVEGVDLDIHVRACGGKCSAERAQSIILDLADGLIAIHNHGIVHRDIKPLNIMIEPDGRPKLIDFGICRNLREATIGNGGIVGTPVWMSPEQTVDSAKVGQRSDLFSLGLVTHYVFTGVPPVQASDPETARRIICEVDFPSLRQLDPSIPAYVDAACLRLLAKKPEDRFRSAEEFRQALCVPSGSGGTAFCFSCGKAIQSTSRFCPSCGAGLMVTTTVLCLACGFAVGNSPTCPGCKLAFSPCDHRIAFDAGACAGKTFRIPEGIYEVGRDIIEPRDYSISRRHFHVACSNGSVQVQDAGSANQTYVAGQLADRLMELRPHQEFLIARNHAIYYSS